MDDDAVKHAVAEELEWAPHVDASGIRISVDNRIVLLTGQVRSLAEKKAAERAVWHVQGVRGVRDELEVRLPETSRHADTEIAHRAKQVLLWDAQIPGSRIHVRSDGGVVTLSGTLDWQYQRAEAEQRIQRLAGVLRVDNRISIRPAPAGTAEVRDRVVRALQRHSEIDASRIAVDAHDQRVTLTGTVPSFMQRRIAESAAWSVPGVNDVLDLMRVGC